MTFVLVVINLAVSKFCTQYLNKLDLFKETFYDSSSPMYFGNFENLAILDQNPKRLLL